MNKDEFLTRLNKIYYDRKCAQYPNAVYKAPELITVESEQVLALVDILFECGLINASDEPDIPSYYCQECCMPPHNCLCSHC